MGVQQILAPAPAPVIMLGTQPQIVSTLFWPKYTDIAQQGLARGASFLALCRTERRATRSGASLALPGQPATQTHSVSWHC